MIDDIKIVSRQIIDVSSRLNSLEKVLLKIRISEAKWSLTICIIGCPDGILRRQEPGVGLLDGNVVMIIRYLGDVGESD